jgi:hypothetical protein
MNNNSGRFFWGFGVAGLICIIPAVSKFLESYLLPAMIIFTVIGVVGWLRASK